jgi:uncharacterized protein
MLERDGYPQGVPCWVDTGQPDPEAAVEFYGGLFGWEFEDWMPSDSPRRYYVARLRGRDVAAVGSQSDQPPPTPVWKSYVWVESADEAVAKAKDAGGQVLAEPFDVGDAGRTAVIADPEGAVLCVWQAEEHRGAQLVNEPGTWNFSDLNTADVDGAKAFYGEVFGWEADSANVDGIEFTLLRLPGYGDYLQRRDPELRERQAGVGAPEGFEDAVAFLVPLPGDQEPHWSVTFAVDDADATAARAAELGAKVVVAPFDAGPTRVAVLSDPQGATFSVSRFDAG